MGIDNLLPLLKPLIRQTHLSQFSGQRLGIDISPWLYKACYQDVMQMEDQHLSANEVSCARYLQDMISLFQRNGVSMYVVYDGRSLGMKSNTINKRKLAKQDNLQKSKEVVDSSQARKYLARGIRVSESVVEESIRILKAKTIPFVVAPYEADSQLCKLFRMSEVTAVVSQDSDLIVYGCNVLYKLDQEGMCQFLDLTSPNLTSLEDNDTADEAEFPKGVVKKVDKENVRLFLSLDPDARTLACVLAGCDYVPSVKGIGIKKAIKFVYQEPDALSLITKLRCDKVFGSLVPQNYEREVQKAYLIFKHALVFNTLLGSVEPLSPLSNFEDLTIIGLPYPQYTQLNIFKGQRNCMNLQPRNLSPLPAAQHSADMVISANLREVQMEIKSRWKQGQDSEMDSEVLTVLGDNEMFEVFCQQVKSYKTQGNFN